MGKVTLMDAVGKCEDLKYSSVRRQKFPVRKENKGKKELGALKDGSGVEA